MLVYGFTPFEVAPFVPTVEKFHIVMYDVQGRVSAPNVRVGITNTDPRATVQKPERLATSSGLNQSWNARVQLSKAPRRHDPHGSQADRRLPLSLEQHGGSGRRSEERVAQFHARIPRQGVFKAPRAQCRYLVPSFRPLVPRCDEMDSGGDGTTGGEARNTRLCPISNTARRRPRGRAPKSQARD